MHMQAFGAFGALNGESERNLSASQIRLMRPSDTCALLRGCSPQAMWVNDVHLEFRPPTSGQPGQGVKEGQDALKVTDL